MDGYLIDGVTGCSVPQRDPEAICHAVETLLTDSIFSDNLLNNGRKFVASYNKNHYIQKIIALLIQEPA
jgi:glycosyltransferase involved in cell wall biosynthesis